MPDPRVTLQKLDIADQRLLAAVRDSAFASPNDGFADRLRSLSGAMAAESAVLREAADQPRLRWNPLPNASRRISYELREGGNRPGPAELWDRFDALMGDLVAAQAGADFLPIADAYGALSEVLATLADRVDDERDAAQSRARKAS